jgi:hypothetical protein
VLLTVRRRACADHPGGSWTFGVERVGLLPQQPNLVYFRTTALLGADAKPEMDCIDAPNPGDAYRAVDWDGNVFFEHVVSRSRSVR